MNFNQKDIGMMLVGFFILLITGCSGNDSMHAGMDMQGDADMDQDMHAGMDMQETKIDDTVMSTSTENLQYAKPMQTYVLENNQTIQLTAQVVKKKINGNEIRMFGYNNMIPGPILNVQQKDTIYVNFTNNLDMETTVHWHGVRVENRFDGVPDVTQEPVKPGESFLYKLDFLDEGMYWYHPHVREDYQQELGLYGAIFVEPEKEDYYASAASTEIVILDDILIKDNNIKEFYENTITHALMGRFGNIMLVNGEQTYKKSLNKGDVIRMHILNVANTRVFNISIPGVKIKLVGGDSGSYEKEEFVDFVVISPSERYTIEILFEKEGEYKLKHTNPSKDYTLGIFNVSEKNANPTLEFMDLNENTYVKESIKDFKKYFDKKPDEEIILDIEIKGMMDEGMMNDGMHKKEKIEWEDTMGMMNEQMTDKTLNNCPCKTDNACAVSQPLHVGSLIIVNVITGSLDVSIAPGCPWIIGVSSFTNTM